MAENTLVMNKIDSLNVEERYKKAMKDLFLAEIQYGNQDDNSVKKAKVKRCRELIIRGQSREDL